LIPWQPISSISVAEKGVRGRLVRSKLLVRSDKGMLEAMLRKSAVERGAIYGSGTILLGCRRAGDKIRIEVWDSGVGISQDQLPHIFQEYYQGAHGAERGGFGLGLAIVRRMGKILEHRIDVRSTPGRGTVFSIEVRAETQAAIRWKERGRQDLKGRTSPIAFLSLKTRRVSGPR